MHKIQDFLTRDHRVCDTWLATTEAAVSLRDWAHAREAFDSFKGAVLDHLAREEQVLFPAFEAHTTNQAGPTRLMWMEHLQMRALLQDMAHTLADADAFRYLRLSRSLSVLMQRHNRKEEDLLFPMFDQVLGSDSAVLITAMQAIGTHRPRVLPGDSRRRSDMVE